ncbi:hypothetical protein SAMN02744133_1213 [Thalassospira xiamenensis M-5 = DSM 17429]|uniref:hypothetical protein n=1 Tax=Thalassospira xiamenensis TaxID=220697 RepID=UPI0002F6D0C8|nr:hypothetical protein [Thalassospira xiamenensis]SIT31877.1 hypothetical protein SAMN02744133_1213 [Thalassospira xiamenensis M-5 = DSM 17429]
MSILRTRNETVGVFHDLPALQKTAEDLEEAGFKHSDLKRFVFNLHHFAGENLLSNEERAAGRSRGYVLGS